MTDAEQAIAAELERPMAGKATTVEDAWQSAREIYAAQIRKASADLAESFGRLTAHDMNVITAALRDNGTPGAMERWMEVSGMFTRYVDATSQRD